jgi:hypothetical protein
MVFTIGCDGNKTILAAPFRKSPLQAAQAVAPEKTLFPAIFSVQYRQKQRHIGATAVDSKRTL